MMAAEDERKAKYIAMWEAQGVEATRLQILTAQTWSHGVKNWAIQWVADRDHERLDLMDASEAEQMSLARAAKDAAFEANALAAEANSIARAASASAKRSADAALINNIISIASAAMAAIAIVVSVIALGHSGRP